VTARNTVFDAGGPLIVGAGLAGLFTALKLSPQPCVILSPDPVGKGASSAWAQGGMAAAVGEGDTADQHAADTIAAGAGLVDPAIAAQVTAEARARVADLLSYGTPFDTDAQGTLLQSREAAHGQSRVLRVSGDQAGKAIMDALLTRVSKTPSIRVLEGVTVDDLAIEEGRVIGVFVRKVDDRTAEPTLIRAPATVLATGGVGGLYEMSTNPARVQGQGLGAAARAGAIIRDPEFVQFHPTGIAIEREPTPLATEALRGHGAHVVDERGERFLLRHHDDAELAPRDIVANAIHSHISAGHQVFLDCSKAIGAAMPEEFPTVTATCRGAGLDPATTPIPIRPAQHYHMGGVETDAQGASSLPGLWACGEVASTGLHGANRLASNSLLEAVVFAARIAEELSDLPTGQHPRIPQSMPKSDTLSARSPVPTTALRQLRKLMDTHVGVTRTANGLRTALAEIRRLETEHAPLSRGFLNMTEAATLIAAGALLREESRGSHQRLDFPKTLPVPKHTRLTLQDALLLREHQ
jgi:L-aspartate oxidase